MTRHETPPTEGRIWYTCNGCERELTTGQVDAKMEMMDRDYSGGIVHSHWKHLCQSCRARVEELLRQIPEVDQ